MLAKAIMLRYTTNCCDMIAMKREVAACMEKDAGQVFRGANVKLGNWRQVTVQRSDREVSPINDVSDRDRRGMPTGKHDDTPGGVYSHRLSYLFIKSAKRRRLFLWQVR